MKKWWRKTVTGDENASVRGYLFGGDDTAALGRSAFRAANSPTAPNSQCFDTVVKLRGTVNTLEKRQAVLQQRIDAAHALAMKKNKAKDKRGALAALKRKKLLEKEKDKLEGSMFTLEQQILTLEQGQMNVEIVRGMQQGNRTMQQINQATNVDRVEDIMEDLQEGIADQQDINNIISQPVGMDYDEDDLLGELDALVLEDDVAQAAPARAQPATIPAMPPAPTHQPVAFPEVPTHDPAPVTDQELADLIALEQEIA